jgi:hypothetical protein
MFMLSAPARINPDAPIAAIRGLNIPASPKNRQHLIDLGMKIAKRRIRDMTKEELAEFRAGQAAVLAEPGLSENQMLTRIDAFRMGYIEMRRAAARERLAKTLA